MHQLRPLACALLCCSLLIGCASETPGNWKQPKVEAEMTRKLELKQITLTPAASGFTGSGTAQDGENYKLTITQDPAKGRLEWTAEGDRGSSEDGFFELN
ncbi:MAG: hypothetical protein ACKPHU_31210 [Planctomycetaceae bacterium]|jgi:hypothetical protein